MCSNNGCFHLLGFFFFEAFRFIFFFMDMVNVTVTAPSVFLPFGFFLDFVLSAV